MERPNMVVQDEQFLRQKSEPATLEEAKEIATYLVDMLALHERIGVGLAASQIGILKRVCLISVKQPIILVNPRIIESAGETWFQEGCLSFPGASVRTRRHISVVVESDYVGTLKSGEFWWEDDITTYFTAHDNGSVEKDVGLLESVVAQHEIDHNDGILFFDREWKIEQRINTNKIKPNDLCSCGKQKKYKKCCGAIV